MDLLDRYTHAVRTYLPKSLTEAQRNDIIAELSENLRAQLDDREAERGRPLTEAEQEAILQRHGHPMIVAGRYQTNPEARVVFGRELIGPGLFPFYLRTLWIVLGISLAVFAVVIVVLALSGNPLGAGEVMSSIVMQGAIQFAVITGIFAVVEKSLPTMPWSARGLPAAQPAAATAPQAPRVSRAESLAEIVGVLVVVGWLTFAYNNPLLLFGPALEHYRLAPVWQQVIAPTLLILAVSVARAVVNLFRPEWVRMKRVVSVVTDIAALGVVLYLLQANSWIVLVNGDAAPGSVNEFVRYGLLSTAIGFLVVIAMDAWKLIRGERTQRERRQAQIA